MLYSLKFAASTIFCLQLLPLPLPLCIEHMSCGSGDRILAKPSAKEAATLDKFRTADGASAIREHCQHLTKEDCRR